MQHHLNILKGWHETKIHSALPQREPPKSKESSYFGWRNFLGNSNFCDSFVRGGILLNAFQIFVRDDILIDAPQNFARDMRISHKCILHLSDFRKRRHLTSEFRKRKHLTWPLTQTTAVGENIAPKSSDWRNRHSRIWKGERQIEFGLPPTITSHHCTTCLPPQLHSYRLSNPTRMRWWHRDRW